LKELVDNFINNTQGFKTEKTRNLKYLCELISEEFGIDFKTIKYVLTKAEYGSEHKGRRLLEKEKMDNIKNWISQNTGKEFFVSGRDLEYCVDKIKRERCISTSELCRQIGVKPYLIDYNVRKDFIKRKDYDFLVNRIILLEEGY